MKDAPQLTVSDHRRDSADLRYVYPVVSRRAGGVSIGINLNTDNACNWRCIYCQVPQLKTGSAPPVDLALLQQELHGFLNEVLSGEFMQRHVPADARRLNDIALSGNGEPTSAAEFLQVVEMLVETRMRLPLPPELKLVLITNGSLLHRENVRQGIRLLAQQHGEVWFKLDRASESGMLLINNTQQALSRVRESLAMAVECCPNTWLQTCWFALDGLPPGEQDEEDYLSMLNEMQRIGRAPRGVLLYGLARPSMQPEAMRLSALGSSIMEAFAERIRALGLTVKISL